MKKTILYTVLATVLGINLILGASVYLTYAEGSEEDDVYRNLELFTAVLERVRNDYVDGDRLTYQELIYGALEGMLSSLDPHSEFLDSDRYEELRKDTEGLFGGVGLVITVRSNVLTVVAPMDGTPAFEQGVLSGDQITRIGGRPTGSMKLTDAVKLLRGEPDSTVEITVFRPDSGETKDFQLSRAEIKVDTVKDINGEKEFPLIAEGVGYVQLTQFGERTSKELDQALQQLEKNGMRALVLDLRDNPGGLLDQAVAVCRKFLAPPESGDEKRQLIVFTEGRRAGDRSEYYATRKGAFADLPMAVLINGGSASASEIVAGCFQDTGRAVIVGQKTFGKGSVQKILPLKGGTAAVRLTTAKYYTPDREVIHGKGILPDAEVEMTSEQEQALFHRLRGSQEGLPEELRQRVDRAGDAQLEQAVMLLKGVDLMTKRMRRIELESPRSAGSAVEPEQVTADYSTLVE